MRLTNLRGVVAAVAVAGLAGAAAGQYETIHYEDFETQGDYQGWTVNGNQLTFGGGNPGRYMGIPFGDFMGVSLRNETDMALTGDLTRHGNPLRISVDVNVFALQNFFGDDINPNFFPLVLQFFDRNDPRQASVFYNGNVLPGQNEGWVTLQYFVPDPTQTDLPPGWGGTGDEDPNTFEPILPDDRSYTDILQNVTEVALTTFEPGFFYGFNFWEVGFDNIRVEVIPAPGALALLAGAGLRGARRRR